MPKDAERDAIWRRLDRSRFHELWERLPSLTVLAALPGWGRTEWMRACDEHLVRRGDPPRMFWPDGREAAAAALLMPASSPVVIFLDDVVTGRDDALWDRIVAAAGPRTRIVLSTLDTPEPEVIAGIDARVLDERDLRFTEHEVAALVEASGVPLASEIRDELVMRLRGVPVLVRQQLARLRRRRGEGVWASLAFTFERTLLEHLAARTAIAESSFAGLLRRGSGFRRFSPQLLAGSVDDRDARSDSAQIDRLEAIPLGEFDIDDETGQRDFVWTTGSWRVLDEQIDPHERRRQWELALRRTREDGRITAQLFYLLQLGRLAEADDLVFDQHRRFLVFTNAETQDALLAASRDLDGHPSLLLLAGELRIRTIGANPQTIRDAATCLDAFVPPHDMDAFPRFRLDCRRAMAAAYAGRRSVAIQHLERVAGMLDATEDSRVRRRADQDPGVAQRVAADLFLAFWAAVQTDRHDLAFGFIGVMREYGDPADTVTQIDRLTAMTEEDFAGTRSCDPGGARPDGLEFSHAAPLVLIEEGDDRDAIERVRPLAARVRPAPTRSAADALLLLSRALVTPGQVDHSFVVATVSLSTSFWDDARPSTFIAFAATVAHLGAGRADEARALVAGAPHPDWFTLTAEALIELYCAAPETALALLEAATATTAFPRLIVTGGVLSAAALACRGLHEAAAARLDTLWSVHPAPRLFRFALRFLPAEVFAVVVQAADGNVSDGVAAVLDAASHDRRPTLDDAVPALTPVEREILVLLRRGLGNAEIAETRGVSHNTIRTQLRLLYRKLRAANRSEAIANAQRAHLFDPEPA
ncbi:response regulator transcription factor [Microbacterium sp. NPDC055910]|uniref:response regulator transcription factor n=1 Tax=Microbacterium sp. NPDC055910 TaxID=3345659 RepID=UPI0035E3042E